MVSRVLIGLVALVLLFQVSQTNYPIFHTLVEVASITISLGVFLLLWNARQYLEDQVFLLLGFALFASSAIDLLHTLSYKGINVFDPNHSADLATQFWIAARFVETLGWLGFAVFLRRQSVVRASYAFFLALTVLLVLSILHWEVFPLCFDAETGLTAFKIGMEYFMIVVLLASLGMVWKNSRGSDPEVTRLLVGALALIALAEMSFTLYQDVFGLSNMLGHIFRIISRYLLYLALIQFSVIKPYSLFFGHLNREKERITESEIRWRTLSQNSPDQIFDLDQDLIIRFCNYPPSDLTMDETLGRSILEIVSPSDVGRVEGVLRETLNSGARTSFETRALDSEGRGLYFETTVVAGVAPDGTRSGLILVARNITERYRHNQVLAARLRISEFALASDISDLLQKVLDESEIITDSKIGFFHFVEEDQETLRLQNWSTRTLEEMCTAEFRGSHYPISQAGVWADCVRLRRPVIHNDYKSVPGKKGMPDGHAEVHREVVLPLIRKGKVVAVLGVGNKETRYTDTDVALLTELADLAWDIVVSKRAEVALKESERELARTLSNLPGMVFRCDNDENWTFRFASQGCRDLTGYDAYDLIGNRTISYAALIHPDDRVKVAEAVQNGLAREDAYQVTYRIIPREGPIKWVWEQGRGVFKDRQLECLEGFIYNITAQMEDQQKRQDMEKKVLEAQKLESLGVLAGGIAHDFNNLLQAMLGFAEMAGTQVEPDHPAQQSLDRVKESATRAADLTRQMLAFSGRGQFTTSKVDISRTVRDMASLLESSVPRSITMHQDLARRLPRVTLDLAQFQQVVLNLITNAAEAIGDNPGNVHLRTGSMTCDAEYLRASLVPGEVNTEPPPPGDYAFVEIQDDGSGMDKATISRIFEPFFTTKFTGRGLGLSAVQGIIRGHRGAMFIDSRIGVGTTIRVLFPASAKQAAPAVQVVSSGAEPVIEGQLRVLLVEDEAKIRQVIADTLVSRGIHVDQATNGEEAVELFREHAGDIDIVLLDVVMPVMGGEECLPLLRQIKPDARIILMSGFTEHEMKKRFVGQKVGGFLPKPFPSRKLLEEVNRIIAAST